ncbi:alpha/beta fold hydrolase [Caulobacter sp. RL271]|jgi:pimeloyl-ACP methyl ester carboxylesterase|uniref:Alpha/beta hydrolase n=1 Tax=Caulobacter segnis TaxID=88688 RepID=A0ABY4ZWI6_9CAUL|nr:alpha/beta fold hydrolase [Caulobacter segnis]USQ96714.1 alpha/beta hydrolase [Caulobacter segnis]
MIKRLATLLALAIAVPAAAEDRRIVVETGVAVASDGSAMPYEIGTLYVPENRAKPGSRRIGVGFARVKAAHPSGAPPIVLLAGGPGVTMLDIVLDHDEAASRRVKVWQDYAKNADLIVIEQRGYTLRGDMMVLKTRALPLDRPNSTAADTALVRDMARRAQAAYPFADLSGYSIGQIADDVADLADALGYPKVSLLAASFGSQWAFAVMKGHPGLVARAVISSAEPLDYGYDLPSQVYSVYQRIAWEADHDAALGPWLPPGGLLAAIEATRARLAKGPVSVNAIDEAGISRQVVVGLEDYQAALLDAAQRAATFPRFVLDTYHGGYGALGQYALADRAAGERSLINPLINIGLDISAERKALLRSDPALPVIGGWNFESYLQTKGEWPTPDAGDAFRRPVRDLTPILFVQGDWDPSTPLENTLAMLPWFPNARMMILHRAQHGGAFQWLRTRPDLAEKVHDFLRTGAVDDLPTQAELAPVVFASPLVAPVDVADRP